VVIHHSKNGTASGRIDGVDLLRGLSIFLVLLNHVHMRLFLAKISYTEGIPAQVVSSLIWNGQRGVQIFFCISGFLIASTSIRRWGGLADVEPSRFYRFRVARIVPLFGLLLIVLSLLHFAGVQDFVVTEKTGGLSEALQAAITFRVNVLEATRGYLPGGWDILWSLSVEEMFYLFFPVVCILLGRSKFLYALLALFVLLGPFGRTVFAHGNEVWSECSYLGSMDAISLGVITAILSSRFRFSSRALRGFTFLGLVLLAFTLGLTKVANRLGLQGLGIDMTVLALGTCMLLIAAAQSEWRAPRFILPLLKLGERSYEIYLTHMFIVFGLFDLFVKNGSSIKLIPLLFVSTILVSAIVGEFIARSYSEPLNKFLREIQK
jgi:peptidoglycan/LPS O-acetylase OafA/YrhL